MGYIRHHSIIVTSYDDEIYRASEFCKEIGLKSTEVLESAINGYKTFCVIPDGSKEGWEHSDEGDMLRDSFIKYLNSRIDDEGYSPISWVCVQYGDDEGNTKIVDDSDKEYRNSIKN